MAIYSSLDDTITTPYHHVFNAVVGRELTQNFAIEGAYVGRRGRNLLIRRDMAMPMNLTDPKSGLRLFTAAKMAIDAYNAAGITGAQRQLHWHRADSVLGEHVPGAPARSAGPLTATQRDGPSFFNNDAPDYSRALFNADANCSPACSIFGPYAYFNSQFSFLSAQSSIATPTTIRCSSPSANAGATGSSSTSTTPSSESKDHGSSVERGGTSARTRWYSGFLVNSLEPGPSVPGPRISTSVIRST